MLWSFFVLFFCFYQQISSMYVLTALLSGSMKGLWGRLQDSFFLTWLRSLQVHFCFFARMLFCVALAGVMLCYLLVRVRCVRTRSHRKCIGPVAACTTRCLLLTDASDTLQSRPDRPARRLPLQCSTVDCLLSLTAACSSGRFFAPLLFYSPGAACLLVRSLQHLATRKCCHFSLDGIIRSYIYDGIER